MATGRNRIAEEQHVTETERISDRQHQENLTAKKTLLQNEGMRNKYYGLQFCSTALSIQL
ncbi:hypothetical protein C5167_005913 [Papaver somniferum]|uniref:Uncharacterized protein n=1 Tax=Papaver somniferum TaxID=3469 RepID=A0A4Y7JFP0_PAPSO|nr:hypothetical protein C5167_005913 [Papaver somniferum]